MEDKKLGMTWLKIYTVLFTIRVITGCLSLVMSLAEAAKYKLFSDQVVILVLFFLVCELAYEIFTLVHFTNKTELGYKLNMVYVFISPFFSAFNTSVGDILNQTIADRVVGLIIACLIFLAAYSIPNYIYFKHRKYLYVGELKEKKGGADNHLNLSTNTSSSIDTKKEIVLETDKPSIKEQNPARKKQEDSKVVHIESTAQSVIPANELRILKELHEGGVLTDEEFAEKKKQLLNI